MSVDFIFRFYFCWRCCVALSLFRPGSFFIHCVCGTYFVVMCRVFQCSKKLLLHDKCIFQQNTRPLHSTDSKGYCRICVTATTSNGAISIVEVMVVTVATTAIAFQPYDNFPKIICIQSPNSFSRWHLLYARYKWADLRIVFHHGRRIFRD